MIVKPVSDFHTCFWQVKSKFKLHKFREVLETILPPCEADSKTVLCCAGDMGLLCRPKSTYLPLLQALGERFYKVLVVSGNHSFYDANFFTGLREISALQQRLPSNVHYLENSYMIIEGVQFIGSCLWTNFNKGDWHTKFISSSRMHDYYCIYQDSYRPITPDHTIQRHEESRQYIQNTLDTSDIPTVILTHHAPSEQSSHPVYRNMLANHAYFTNLEAFILKHPQIRYWIHGHMHTNSDYFIGDTRILCNPYGYYKEAENPGFAPELTFEI